MKNFVAVLAAMLAVMTLVSADVQAKRLGGGMSVGKQYSSFSKPASPQRSAATNQTPPGAAAANAGRQSGIGRWLGPLAGLAAGGLLASLFFGDAFDGLQIMDILLFAGLIFGAMALFKAMRAKSPRTVGAMPGAAPGPFGGQAPAMNFEAEAPAAGTGASADDAPGWFDPASFADGAKTHFIRLQAAWDKGDFRDIREYTTPEMFAELQQEHRRSIGEDNYTEVMTLNADYLGARRENDQVVVSVRFTGMLREDRDAAATDLDEIWHVVHDWASPQGDWLIAGIQQNA